MNRACPPSTWSRTTTTAVAGWRRRTCSSWVIAGSRTSSARARWGACDGRATRRPSPTPASIPMRRGGLDRGPGRRVATELLRLSAPADRDLRGERPVGGRRAGRGGRARPAGSRGPVGRGLRQHRVRPAAPPVVDHDRRPHRRGGAGGRPDAHRPASTGTTARSGRASSRPRWWCGRRPAPRRLVDFPANFCHLWTGPNSCLAS